MYRLIIFLLVLLSLIWSGGAFLAAIDNTSAQSVPLSADQVDVFIGGIDLAVGTLSLLTVVLGFAAVIYFRFLRSAIHEEVQAEMEDTVRRHLATEYIRQGYTYYEQFEEAQRNDEAKINVKTYIHLLNIAIDLGRSAIKLAEKLDRKKHDENSFIFALALGNTSYFQIEHSLATRGSAIISEDEDECSIALEALDFAYRISEYIAEIKALKPIRWHHIKESELFVYWKTETMDKYQLRMEIMKLINDYRLPRQWREDTKKGWSELIKETEKQPAKSKGVLSKIASVFK